MKTNWTNNVDPWDEAACEALAAELNAKAAAVHSHAQADVTNLATSLGGKANTVHSHAQADVTNLATSLGGKANTAHTHAPADITGLATSGVAAPTGVAATDTAAIQAAHDALPASGGEIRLQAGTYYRTPTALNFTKKVKLIGASQMDASAVGGTTLFSNSASAVGIVATAEGSVFRDFAMVNGSAGIKPTSGIGLSLTHATNCTVTSVSVHGFFDGMVFENGLAFTVTDCHLQSPGRYGIRINNSSNFDAGDMRVAGNWFLMDGAFADATAAVRWETAGGLRCSDNKIINGATFTWIDGFDLAWNGGGSVDTADIFVHDNSIENIDGIGVKLSRTAGSHLVHDVMLKNNEFLNVPTAIQVGPGWDGVEIGGNTCRGCATGISLLNGVGIVQIRPNNFWPAVTTCVALGTGMAVGTIVEPQNIWSDGTIFTSAMDYLQGVPQFGYPYTRAIDWAVSSTATTMWTLGVANAMAGMIEVRVSGFRNTVGGGYSSRKFLYVVANAGGAVTLTDVETITHGGNPSITMTTGTNSIAVKLATSDSNLFIGGQASIWVDGHLTSLKRGA